MAAREAIADLMTGLGFSTLPYDPVIPVAPYATVNLPDEIRYHRTLDGAVEADLTVSLYVGTGDEASANRALDKAISWNVQGAIPLQLEAAARALNPAPWSQLTVDTATNRRQVDLENTVGVLLAIDLTVRLIA